MPRYLVTSGSHFEPMTYDELVKPIAQMTDALNATQDAYDTLNLETKSLANYISKNPEDAKARKMYDDYVAQLDSLQNELWNNGYTARARRGLSTAKSGYASDITRLQKAITTRQERGKLYSEMKLKDPSLVMGDNPVNAGLDAYLDDENYGMNFFAYSGNTFTQEVAADAKARMNEMLNDPQYSQDPRLVGYIQEKITKGFSSEDIETAANAVRSAYNGDSSLLNSLGFGPSILARILMSHMNSTGAVRQYVDENGNTQGNLTPTEFNRLLEYGISGLAHGIGDTSVKQVADQQWQYNRDIAKMNHQAALAEAQQQRNFERSLALEAAKAAAKGGTGSGSGSGTKSTESLKASDYDIVTGSGAGAEEAKKYIQKHMGSNNLSIKAPDGRVIKSTAEAAETVYSGDLRRELLPVLGFDIGRDPMKRGVVTTSGAYITGRVIKNGIEYETMLNPRADGGKGAVHFRPLNDETPWARTNVSAALTKAYREGRAKFEQNLEKYKDTALYNEAKKIDPDEQFEMYTKFGVDLTTPLTSYQDTVMSMAHNNPTTYDTYMSFATKGTDSGGYLERFSQLLSNNMEFKSDGNSVRKERNRNEATRAYKKDLDFPGVSTLHHIRRAGDNMLPTDDYIRRYNSVFKFDDGNITNIKNVALTENGLANGYFVIELTNSKEKYCVGYDMIGDERTKAVFTECKEMMDQANSDPMLTPQYKALARREILQTAITKLRDELGYVQNTQGQSGTSEKNNN